MLHHLRQLSCAVILCIGCDAAAGEGNVGPRGATLVSDDGRFSLTIPPGALDETVHVQILRQDCDPFHIDALGPCYAASPQGTGFVFPATIEYEIDELTLDDMASGGVAPEDLAVIVHRRSEWRFLADRIVDLDDGVVRASAGYLSSFALVER